jgi:predicted alpha/beta-fold hydrolase
MGTSLLGLVKANPEELARNASDSTMLALIDTLQLTNPTLEEFDHSFSRIVGGNKPPYPFETAMDYYAWSSSHKLLDKVQIPFLAINSADDPIVQDVPTDVGGNGLVALAITSGGGHLGWFESTPGALAQLQRWITKPVTEWLRAVGEDLVHETPRGLPLHEVDGFIKEVGGRDDLGCKEVEGGGSVTGLPQSGVFQGL